MENRSQHGSQNCSKIDTNLVPKRLRFCIASSRSNQSCKSHAAVLEQNEQGGVLSLKNNQFTDPSGDSGTSRALGHTTLVPEARWRIIIKKERSHTTNNNGDNDNNNNDKIINNINNDNNNNNNPPPCLRHESGVP